MFPKIGVSQNVWFIMENRIKMDDLGIPLLLENTHIENYSKSKQVAWNFHRFRSTQVTKHRNGIVCWTPKMDPSTINAVLRWFFQVLSWYPLNGLGESEHSTFCQMMYSSWQECSFTWWCFTDSIIVNHHFSPAFGEWYIFCYFSPTTEQANLNGQKN